MTRLGRRRLSKFQLSLLIVFALFSLGILWLLNRPLPEYLVAEAEIGYGTKLSDASLSSVSLDLGLLQTSYLEARNLIGDQVLTRPIGKGELIPLSALGTHLPLGKVLLTVNPAKRPSERISAGNQVEVWLVPMLERVVASEPELLGLADVNKVIKAEGIFSDDFGSYELLLDADLAPRLLKAMSEETPIYLLLAGR